jgi:hypothetical protein
MKTQVGIQSSKFGKAEWEGGDNHTRITRLRQAQVLGAEIDPSTGGAQDNEGIVYFLVPNDKIEDFKSLVNSWG